MAQPAGFSKNPLNINPFWDKASVEPPLEWSKCAAIMEMAIFAKDGIEVRNLLRARPALVEPPEPVYQIEITGETDAQRKIREVRNQEKRVGWENHVIKAGEKGVLCNSFRWDEADAKVRSYLFLCLGAKGQRQIQQKRPNLELHTVSTQELMTTLEDIFVTTRIIAFERYNFICRKQKKNREFRTISFRPRGTSITCGLRRLWGWMGSRLIHRTHEQWQNSWRIISTNQDPKRRIWISYT